MLHTNANYTCLGNANLFTLHFSQITANSPSQFRKGFAGPGFWRRKSSLAAIAGVRRDLGKKKKQFSFFLQHLLIRCWWERDVFQLVRRRGKKEKSLRFSSTAELGINRAILDKPLCLGMWLQLSLAALMLFRRCWSRPCRWQRRL